jgi:hypothetical protein
MQPVDLIWLDLTRERLNRKTQNHQEGFMPRTAKHKQAQADPATELRHLNELVDKMLVPNPEQLRTNVLWMQRSCSPMIVQGVLKVLAERAFKADSGPATDALGFFGAAAYPIILQAFCDIKDAERRPRVVGLLERLGAEVSPKRVQRVGDALCDPLHGAQGRSTHVLDFRSQGHAGEFRGSPTQSQSDPEALIRGIKQRAGVA